MSSYIALWNTHQPSMLVLAKEHECYALSSWALNWHVIFNRYIIWIYCNLFISWQVVNYLQSHTLSIRYNYLLAIISRQYISLTLSISYRLLFTSQQLSPKAITAPTNKDPQLHSTTINTRFHRTLNTPRTHMHTCLHTYVFILSLILSWLKS